MVHHGNCLEVMSTMDENCIDAIVTDPPYGLSFMGKDWDHGVPGEHLWREALRVAKPGCHLLAFGGTRTFHRLAVAIEDAGWEIRDTVMWVYGSGFPKSHDVSKAIDREAGAERIDLGVSPNWRDTKKDNGQSMNGMPNESRITLPATDSAKKWEGWGTALKPAWEPIIVARKTLDGTVAENVQKWGTGAINIDGCRIGTNAGWSYPNGRGGSEPHHMERGERNGIALRPSEATSGRWPANLIHDGSEEVLELFPHSTSGAMKKPYKYTNNGTSLGNPSGCTRQIHEASSGSAARFFYCSKASKRDRDEGNKHPTVKPTELMRYLCRLVTPPNGLVLDPFCGSGSTGKAAILEGFRFVGIEKEEEYVEIANRRIDSATTKEGR